MKTLGEIIPDCIGNSWQMVKNSHACHRKTQCVIKKASRCPCCDHSTGFKRHTIRAERRWSKQVIREQLVEVEDILAIPYEVEQMFLLWEEQEAMARLYAEHAYIMYADLSI